jgi:hypothetical protein
MVILELRFPEGFGEWKSWLGYYNEVGVVLGIGEQLVFGG